jgi:hypothetical protein
MWESRRDFQGVWEDSLSHFKHFFLFRGCPEGVFLFLDGGQEGGEEFASVVGCFTAKHPVDSMEQLASGGDDHLQLGLVTPQECFVERLQVRIETNGTSSKPGRMRDFPRNIWYWSKVKTFLCVP